MADDQHVIGLTIKGKNEATQPDTIDMGAQRRLLQQHKEEWKALGDTATRVHETHHKSVAKTKEVFEDFGGTLLKFGRGLGIVFSTIEVGKFARSSVIVAADTDRAIKNAQETAQINTQQMQRARDQLELLERETGTKLDLLGEQYARFMAGARVEGEKGIKLFEPIVEAATLLEAKTDDVAVAMATRFNTVKLSIEQATDELKQYEDILPGVGQAFSKHLPRWTRELDVAGINTKTAGVELAAVQKVLIKAYGGDQEAAAAALDQLLEKALHNPKYMLLLKQLADEHKGPLALLKAQNEDLRKQAYPREFATRLNTVDFLFANEAIGKAYDSIDESMNNAAADTETSHEKMRHHISDAKGKIDELNGSLLQLERTVGHALGEQVGPLMEATTRGLLNMSGHPDFSNLGPTGPKIEEAMKRPGIISNLVKPFMQKHGENYTPATGFATGGIVDKPTMAMIGEAGPEAVIPLADIQQAKDKEEASTVGRLHQLALMGKPPPAFHDWDDIVSGALKHMGGGGSSGGGGASGTADPGTPSTGDGKSKTDDATTKTDSATPPKEGETAGPGGAKFDPKGSAGVNSTLLAAVKAGAESLPEGYTVRVASGYRPGDPRLHGRHLAMDIQIYDKAGKKVQFYGQKAYDPDNADPTGLYTKVARFGYGWLLKNHPEEAGKFGWGGSFPIPQAGAWQGHPDIMHYSLANERGRWKQNWPQTLGALYPEEPKKMAEGGVVTDPTLALLGESGPEARVPLRSGQAYADRDALLGDDVQERARKAVVPMEEADIAGTPDWLEGAASQGERMRALAQHNEALFRPGARAPSVIRALRRYERGSSSDEMGPPLQAGTPEGQVLGTPNLFGGSEFEHLKQTERGFEDAAKKDLGIDQGERYGFPPEFRTVADTGGSSGGAGASGNYPDFGGGFGGGSTTSTPPGLEFQSVADAKRAAGVRSDLTDVIKQAQHDNPDLHFGIGPGGGTRTQAEQDEMVRRGVSWTRQSHHIGGNAADVVPIIDGKMRWGDPKNQDTPEQIAAVNEAFKKIDTAMYTAATKLGVIMGPEAMDPKFHEKDPGHYSIPPPKPAPPVQRFSPGPPPTPKIEPKVTTQAVTGAKPERAQPSLPPQVRRNTRRQVARQYNNFHGNAEAQHQRTTHHGSAGHI